MKNLTERYLAYLKDNPEHYWFKRKLYGWGWTPATREGWLVLGVFLLALVGNAVRLDIQETSSDAVLRSFFIQTAVLILILIGICYKTGERPRWQWGIPEDSEGDDTGS